MPLPTLRWINDFNEAVLALRSDSDRMYTRPRCSVNTDRSAATRPGSTRGPLPCPQCPTHPPPRPQRELHGSHRAHRHPGGEDPARGPATRLLASCLVTRRFHRRWQRLDKVGWSTANFWLWRQAGSDLGQVWTCPAFTDGWFLWLMVSDMSSVVPSQGGGRGRGPLVAPAPQVRFRRHG